MKKWGFLGLALALTLSTACATSTTTTDDAAEGGDAPAEGEAVVASGSRLDAVLERLMILML